MSTPCPICRSGERFEPSPDACRHPLHWPDRDPARPYFPEVVVTTSWPIFVREVSDAVLSGLIAHWAEALPLDQGLPLAACWAADVRATPTPGDVLAVACAWADVR